MEDIKKDHANKVTEQLFNLTEKLKDVGDRYLLQSEEDFQDKTTQAFELLHKYPEKCATLKINKFKMITSNGVAMFKNCDGFKFASDRLNILLEETEHVLSEIEERLAIIAKDSFNCTMHSPFVVIHCMMGLKEPISDHINYIVQVSGEFINYAEETVEEIIADILSCIGDASTEMNKSLTQLFDEVKECATDK